MKMRKITLITTYGVVFIILVIFILLRLGHHNTASNSDSSFVNTTTSQAENDESQSNNSKENIINVFKENKDSFAKIANDLMGSPGLIRCYIDTGKLTVLKDGSFEDKNVLSSSKEIMHLLKDLDYSMIMEDADQVTFIKHVGQYNGDYEQDIVYVFGGETPVSHLPSVDYTQINGNWFYYSWGLA
jgi:hypothetical protein